ncbi:hypothetical protein BJ742DRAFT_418251 [Cladochytrium replicatum]|nr:hypothetical protein BJ742DRAFT_418251 [Cladochytrium replicatum]
MEAPPPLPPRHTCPHISHQSQPPGHKMLPPRPQNHQLQPQPHPSLSNSRHLHQHCSSPSPPPPARPRLPPNNSQPNHTRPDNTPRLHLNPHHNALHHKRKSNLRVRHQRRSARRRDLDRPRQHQLPRKPTHRNHAQPKQPHDVRRHKSG